MMATTVAWMTWMVGPVGGVGACVLGGAAGWLLCRAVAAWFRATDDTPPSAKTRIIVSALVACAAALLWWWEIGRAGQLPDGIRADVRTALRGELISRYLAHLVLGWLLGAATWIDLRQRVIPDWITVPGTLLGLVAAWAWPRLLLPVAVEVPRSFAAPDVQPAVLAWYGGLHAGGGGPFASMPHVAGLTLAGAIFVAWWGSCTEPAPDGHAAVWASPRNVLLVIGLAAITAAWWSGSERFESLQSALVGIAVSGGLVWATRAGASHALGREAMGLGDVTLMAMVGAWLGWQACVLTFFMAAFIGLGHGLVQFVRHQENELPFGPSLCLAAAIVVVTWRPIWQAAAEHFERPDQLALVVAAVVVLTAVTLFVWRLLRGGG